VSIIAAGTVAASTANGEMVIIRKNYEKGPSSALARINDVSAQITFVEMREMARKHHTCIGFNGPYNKPAARVVI
jgi:hypothetical protein